MTSELALEALICTGLFLVAVHTLVLVCNAVVLALVQRINIFLLVNMARIDALVRVGSVSLLAVCFLVSLPCCVDTVVTLLL